MLSSAEFQAMQATATGALPDSGTILRPTVSNDGMGGQSQDWNAVGTAVCRVRPSTSPDERPTAGKVTAYTDWVITFPGGTDVRSQDRVQAIGRTFEVVGPLAGSWDIATRVACAEVT